MRFPLPVLLLLGLAACSQAPLPAPAPAPAVPDWIELNGDVVPAELRDTPQELSRPPFAAWVEGRPRLLLYAFPQVQRITLPADGVARDVAFFDLGGRVLDLYPAASCQAQAPCVALPSRFPAMSVLIAPGGTLAQHKMARASQMRWMAPAPATQTIPLRD